MLGSASGMHVWCTTASTDYRGSGGDASHAVRGEGRPQEPGQADNSGDVSPSYPFDGSCHEHRPGRQSRAEGPKGIRALDCPAPWISLRNARPPSPPASIPELRIEEVVEEEVQAPPGEPEHFDIFSDGEAQEEFDMMYGAGSRGGDVSFTEPRRRQKRSKSQSRPWKNCLLYTSPSPGDVEESRMPSSA